MLPFLNTSSKSAKSAQSDVKPGINDLSADLKALVLVDMQSTENTCMVVEAWANTHKIEDDELWPAVYVTMNLPLLFYPLASRPTKQDFFDLCAKLKNDNERKKLLVSAAAQNDMEALQWMVEKFNPTIDCTYAFFAAAKEGAVDTLELLFKRDSMWTSHGVGPQYKLFMLEHAVEECAKFSPGVDALGFLLEKAAPEFNKPEFNGPEFNEVYKLATTALYLATDRLKDEHVRFLARKEEELKWKLNWDGSFIAAARRNSTTLMHFAEERGAHMDWQYALDEALLFGAMMTAEIALQRGAVISSTSFERAAAMNRKDTLSWIKNNATNELDWESALLAARPHKAKDAIKYITNVLTESKSA